MNISIQLDWYSIVGDIPKSDHINRISRSGFVVFYPPGSIIAQQIGRTWPCRVIFLGWGKASSIMRVPRRNRELCTSSVALRWFSNLHQLLALGGFGAWRKVLGNMVWYDILFKYFWWGFLQLAVWHPKSFVQAFPWPHWMALNYWKYRIREEGPERI